MRFRITGDGWQEELNARRDRLGREWQVQDAAGDTHSFRVVPIEGRAVVRLAIGDSHHTLTVLPGNRPGEPLRFLLDDEYFEVGVQNDGDILEETLGSADPEHGACRVLSVMPGVVTRILVAEGESVEEDQPLLILEAMKMENEIRSPRSGTIAHLAVSTGTTVASGELLVIIDPK